MPITAADLTSPVGDVDGAVWFPSLSGGQLTTLLTGYIADAYSRTANDRAAAQWSYYRAATAVADRITGEAASKTVSLVDQGSKSTSLLGSQIQYWIDKAARYLAEFQELIAVVATTTDPLGGFRVLTSLRHG